MRRREHPGWMTRFGSFVAEVSVVELRTKLVESGLPVTSGMVYSWVAGRRSPRLPVAVALVGLAAGRVSLEDIVKHPEEVRNGAGQDGSASREGARVDGTVRRGA